MAVAPAGRGADGEDHRQPQADGEIEIELRAEVGVMVAAAVGRFGRHAACESGWSDVAQVKGRHTDLGKTDRGQVHFARQPGEAPGGNLVDSETGEALHLSVTLLGSVIDIVVAEGAEVI